MTALPLRDFTAAEQDRLDAIEAAPAAEESFDPDAERIARLFHESYERLAPTFSYETRPASAVPWEDVPAANRALMCATVREVIAVLRGPSSDAERAVERVLALADEWDTDEDARYSSARIAKQTAARSLRRAVAGD